MTLKGREFRILVLDDLSGNDSPEQLPAPIPEKPSSGIDRLDRALGIIFDIEGGYSNHPRDNGGPTNHGITQATLSAWRGYPVSVQDVRKLTTAEAVEIYREKFWKAVEAHKLPKGIDIIVFDQAVNSGPKTAQILLQQTIRALGQKIAVDGDIGSKTALALSRLNYHAVIDMYSRLTMERYRRLSDWPVFGKGWTNRNKRVIREAHIDVAQDDVIEAEFASVTAPDRKPEHKAKEAFNMQTLLNLIVGFFPPGTKTPIGIIGLALTVIQHVWMPDLLTPEMDWTLYSAFGALAGVGIVDKMQRLLTSLGIDPPTQPARKPTRTIDDFSENDR